MKKQYQKHIVTIQERCISKGLLLICLISLSLFATCKNQDVDNVITADYIYVNPTINSIEIELFRFGNNTIHKIRSGESIKISEDLFAGNNNLKIVDADSVFIKTSTNKSTSYYPETISPRNIIKIENYDYLQISSNHHEYKFTFTESDFK